MTWIGGMWRWLDGRLGKSAGADIPTVDYYFLGALDELVARGDAGRCARPVRRLGPHTFASRDALVIIRYAGERELEIIGQQQWQRVYYVLDDMIPIASRCEELPADYRRRLAGFTDRVLPRILDLDPTIVAPSDAILALFPGRPVERLDPCSLAVAPDLSHFDRTDGQASSLWVAFLGTRSHSAGISFLCDVAERVARTSINFRLTLFLGKHVPPRLARLPGIDNRPALDWPSYRRVLAAERFHVLLAPLPATPFNSGRSITKILDAAAVGACGLYSDRKPFSDAIENGIDGLLLPDEADAWADAVTSIAHDRAPARKMAEGGIALTRRLADPRRVRRFWLERLGLED